MPLSLIADIAEAVPSVRCIKLESTPTAAQTRELKELMQQRAGIESPPSILTGLGGLYGMLEASQSCSILFILCVLDHGLAD